MIIDSIEIAMQLTRAKPTAMYVHNFNLSKAPPSLLSKAYAGQSPILGTQSSAASCRGASAASSC